MSQLSSAIFAIFTITAVANATTVTYVTPAGSTYAGLAEDLSVTVTTAANSITVAFDNFDSSPKADTQAISGLELMLNILDPNTPTLLSPKGIGTLIQINNSNSPAATDTTDTIDHWEVSNAGEVGSSTKIYMDAFTGGSPHDLIIGPAPGNIYTNANGSIRSHNPWILQFGTFTITLAGVTDQTQVTGATFNFGTKQGTCIGGTSDQCVSGVVSTPEPGGCVPILLAAIPFGIGLRRRRG
jgi:hypothetical protein